MSDEIRKLLRRGDPLDEDPGLSPSEIAGMRQAMLAAVAEPGATAGWMPALAGGMLAALALGLVLFVDLSGMREAVHPPAVQGHRRPSADGGAVTDPSAGTTSTVPGQVRAALDTAVRTSRRIDFVTRGGTRVIWTLDPGFEL
jgi:hypothetical protein